MELALSLLQNIPLINNVLLIGFIFAFAIVFWREHKNSNSPIAFSDLLVDPKTNKVTNTKLGHFIGIFMSGWIVMYFAQKVSADQIGGMFPWVFGTWLTFLVTSQGIKSFTGSKDKTEIQMKDDVK